MAVPTRSKRSESAYADGNADMVRGSILIGIGVIIAVVLLWQGFGDDEDGVATGGTTTSITVAEDGAGTTQATDATGDTTGDTTDGTPSTIGTGSSTTIGTARPNDQITVIVANGTQGSGVAGANGDTLEAAGFKVVDPDNAADRNTATSTVYYAGEDKAEGEKVAEALGIDKANVQPMPNPPPTEDGVLNGASILVVIGADKA
jgi:hypothetical protein